MKVCVNGVIGDVNDLRISPLDHGLLVGDGVFETMRVYGGIPFAWTRHLERLERSARGLGLDLPSAAELREQSEWVLQANTLTEARLRVTVTGGPAPLGSERASVPPTVIIAASAVVPWPPTASVVTVEWPRNERGATAGLKTTSYAENVRALAYAQERGCTEAIFGNTRNELCEATGSNVFVVRDAQLMTPPVDSGCLLGVTRALVLEIARDYGLNPMEARLPMDAIHTADEAFLTSTTREVQAISQIDDTSLPAGPGPITAQLSAAFTDLIARNLDP